MEQIVGESPCTISKVCKVMLKAKGAEVLKLHWINFARDLLSDDCLQLKPYVQGDCPNYYELFFQILTKFRAGKGKEAKLAVLMATLREWEHNEVADELQATFVAGRDDSAVVNSLQTGEKEKLARKQKHIQKHYGELLENTQVNVMVTAKLYSGNVLSQVDVAELDATPNTFEKSRKLYMT